MHTCKRSFYVVKTRFQYQVFSGKNRSFFEFVARYWLTCFYAVAFVKCCIADCVNPKLRPQFASLRSLFASIIRDNTTGKKAYSHLAEDSLNSNYNNFNLQNNFNTGIIIIKSLKCQSRKAKSLVRETTLLQSE